MKNIYIHQALSKLLTDAFTGFFGAYSLIHKVKEVPRRLPENFQPILRFALCSDLHLSDDKKGMANAEKFKNAIVTAYEFSEKSVEHNTLDALIVAGDITESGKAREFEIYSEIINSHIKTETQALTCMGNHDYIECRDMNKPQKAVELFEKHVNGKADTHKKIAGYHFIGLSYDSNGKEHFFEKLGWLTEQLDAAVSDTGNKPIFVFQHPHPALTVYGSINWGNRELKRILKKYPQVVDFSGHSHYAANDPRSIHQGSFTAVGCGAVTGSMGNLGYISGDEYGDGESGAFWLCEADKNGNVRLRLYDIVSDCFFSDIDYYLTDLCDKSKRAYTWRCMKDFDTAPVFPNFSLISVSENTNGNISLEFPEACGYYRAENYKLALISSRRNKLYKTVLSDYIRATDFEKTVSLGKLKKGLYTVKITAFSPYAKKGETIKHRFRV